MKTPAIAMMIALLCSAGCAGRTEHGADEPHWGYQGESGPERWALLDSSFATCASGQRQSPIDLAGFTDVDLPQIEFRYPQTAHEIIHNGHTIQVGVRPGNTIVLGGQTYELRQFHFHAPSENTIQGKSYPLEAHFVHADSSGALAVVAVMFEEGNPHRALETLWNQMPAAAGPAQPLATGVSPNALLPSERDYFRFAGSLTTPPCTEGVRWLVMKRPASASREQIEQFAQAVGHANSRPVQALNGRTVEQ